MPRTFILTLMAANRVGILSTVTRALTELNADIQEVSQTVMQKYFTIILAAEFPAESEPAKIVSFIEEKCQKYGIEVSLKEPATESLQDDPSPEFEKYFLTINGHDEPGIIGAITTLLSDEQIDVTDLYALRNKADDAFAMVMELSMPGSVDAVELQTKLEDVGSRSGLSAALQHENIFLATSDPRPVRIAVPQRIS